MKKINETETKKTLKPVEFCYYSKVLKEPFDSLIELQKAEESYYAAIKAKEDKASAKKADAQKVEDAYKALNAARKLYKENIKKLTEEYSSALEQLKKTFETNKTTIQKALSEAEELYSVALKEFTEKYPEGYHLTLKDGDFETTISSQSSANSNKARTSVFDLNLKKINDLFDLLFF